MDSVELFHSLYGPRFTYWEFCCKCERHPPLTQDDEGEWLVMPEFKAFMENLMAMREALAFPFHINSGYRCPEYNAEISSTGLDGPHTKGAADISVAFERAYKLNKIAAELQMGIGLKQTGDVAGRFIHVDNLGARIWTY